MTAEYDESIANCVEAIEEMPIGEMRYHLLLLLSSLKGVESGQTKSMLAELQKFIPALNGLMRNPNDPDQLKKINKHYQNLVHLSQTKTLGVQVGYALINVAASILGFLSGLIGGLIGGTAGLARGLWNLSNPFSACGIGLITGFCLGAAVGFRAPKKLLKDELTRQLKFCLDDIAKCMKSMQSDLVEPLSHYENIVKDFLLAKYFDNDEEAYNRFIQDEKLSYSIITNRAQFIGNTTALEGYLGHHARILIPIEEGKREEVIEFSTGNEADLSRYKSQIDKRENVKGETLVKMMALHKQLLMTHSFSIKRFITEVKPGERDCFSYVDKVLTGVGEEPTTVKRFDGSENWVGKNIVGFFIGFLSPFRSEPSSFAQDKIISSL